MSSQKPNQLIPDTDPKVIQHQVDHMGRRSSRELLNKVGGSVSNIEEMTRDEFMSIRGVGEKTAQSIGIWDENGFPVEKVTRNPCPVCGDSCEEFDILSGTSNFSKPVDVSSICVDVSDGYRRGEKCVVKIGLHN